MLAKKGKRILARVIDMSIVFALTLILFLGVIYPSKFDKKTYEDNYIKMFEIIEESDLYIVADNGNYRLKTGFNSIVNLDDIYSIDVMFEGKIHTIKLTQSLYYFYSSKLDAFTNLSNFNYENYCNNILKVGSEESNIKSFNLSTYTFELIDPSKPEVCVSYILAQYETAGTLVATSNRVQELNEANQKLMIDSIIPIIPLLIGISFIFDLLIPMFSKESQTIGKHLLKLVVLSKDGYHLKKTKNITRFIVYICFEIILSVITLGGVLLISYTLFMFKKNRRCLHDLVAGSVVVDAKESIFFSNPVEERYYIERQKRRGFYYE